MTLHFDAWRDIDKLETIITTLRECQARTMQLLSVSVVHQVRMMTPGAAEAAEFPERIGAHLCRPARRPA
ncbi:MAG: hypothetical protein HY216_10360 [Candidatus Rokubacteria bacterium]|nr:hypothetical protein [Candidatus Rokubacteria bacterium]